MGLIFSERHSNRELCHRYQRLHPHLGPKISHCAFEIGWLAEELGELDEARASMQVVLAFERGDTFERGFAAGLLLLLDGRPAEAAGAMEVLAEREREAAQPWVRFKAANAWIAAAVAQRRAGQPARARAHLESARAMLETLPSFTACRTASAGSTASARCSASGRDQLGLALMNS